MNRDFENENEERKSLHNNYIDRNVDISHLLEQKGKTDSFAEKGFVFNQTTYSPRASFAQAAASKEPVQGLEPTKPKKSRAKWIAAFLVLVLLGGAAAFAYQTFFGGGGRNIVNTEWGSAAFDVPQSEDIVNVLAIGFDKGGYRTDTMMIISFNPKTSGVNLISVPRDTLVGVNGKRMKLNAVFAIGKFDLLISTIRNMTGMPIHYYMAVDTAGFRNIVDALGGVQFNVPRDMKYYDPYQGLNIDLKKGPQLLDGAKAEQLVRFRKYAMGDLERENVQKAFIKAMIEQKLTLANVSDVSKLEAIYKNLSTYFKSNIAFKDILKYFVSAMKIKSENFKAFTLPGEPKYINGISYFVYDQKKTNDLFKQLMGENASPIYDYAEGLDLYDTSNLTQKAQQSSGAPFIIHKSTDGKTSTGTSPSNEIENISIDDGKDYKDSDIIDIDLSKPDDLTDIPAGDSTTTPQEDQSSISTDGTSDKTEKSTTSGGSATTTQNKTSQKH